jgi:hypothetical protein
MKGEVDDPSAWAAARDIVERKKMRRLGRTRLTYKRNIT